MSELIDRIPGRQSAVSQVRQIVRQGLAFKSRQKTTGRGGQLGYVIDSGQAADLIETFPPTSTGVQATYRITFTGDGTQKFPIVAPATEIRANGVLLARDAAGRYTYSSGGNTAQTAIYDQPDPAFFESDTQSAWTVAIGYQGNITIRLKARGRGSSNGTWSIVRTS